MVYNNCALDMLLYKQCRGFYCCSKRVVNVRSVFQEHHLVVKCDCRGILRACVCRLSGWLLIKLRHLQLGCCASGVVHA